MRRAGAFSKRSSEGQALAGPQLLGGDGRGKSGRGEIDALCPTRDATDRFNEEVRAAYPGTVWATGCKSWSIGKDGLPHAWPWTPERHRAILVEREREGWETVPADRGNRRYAAADPVL